ncbi:MAG TPA: hypothetical protein VKH64_01135 [Candidatus Binatia bacterium]|nr:hypothetical protein [Candidatus Binatia bacterium]
MNYLQPYTAASADRTVLSAWDTQVAHAAEAPWLDRLLLDRGSEIFAEFTARYNELRALPRSARRALQRSLARSGDSATVPPEWRRKLAYSVAGAALLLALGGVAHAGSMTVSPKTPPGINASDGKCSLIEAIVNANSHATVHSNCPGATTGPNTINLPAGTQTLTTYYDSYYGYNTGLPLITSIITIEGNSKAKIVRGKTAPDFRHFAVAVGGDLTLNEVALSGGSAYYGGAIFNRGSVTLNWCTVSGNFAARGGAIANYKGYLAINDNSILSRNGALIGGAIYNRGGSSLGYGEVVLHDSLITGNKAFAGGGIFNAADTNEYADLFIYHSTFSGNSAYYYGAGIYDYYGYTYLYNSLITTNRAGRYGGGVFGKEGSYLKINRTTFSKNSAGIDGGGIFVIDSELRLTNSSVTGNKAGRYGGGVELILSLYSLSGNSVIKNKAGVAGSNYYIFP